MKMFLPLLVLLLFIGCSNENENLNQTGYVKEIRPNQVLIIETENRDEALKSTMFELANKDIPSIWLTLSDNQMEGIAIGVKVQYTTEGAIDASSPAKGTAKEITILQP
jgi:hypothetical protein